MIQHRALPLHLTGWLVKVTLLLALLLLPIAQVSAETIEVSDDCSLHDAVKAANDNSNTHNTDCTAGSGADTIKLPANGKTVLTARLPTITSNMTIEPAREGSRHTIDGNSQYRVLMIGSTQSNPQVTLNNLIITKGYPDRPGGGEPGGGIYIQTGTLTINNSVISNNNSGSYNGAGLHNDSTLIITNSIISGNKSTDRGGGMHSGQGSTTIRNSVFANNNANYGAGINVDTAANLTIENSTFYGNTATNSGGGIRGAELNVGSITLTHVTIVNNSAPSGGGVRGISVSGTFKLRNSIVANNKGGDCSGDFRGGLTENINSIVKDGGCTTGSQWQDDPKLASLRGSPPYFPLYVGSPAINAGSRNHCSTTDQRGVTRREGEDEDCDLGAYEGAISRHQPETESDDGDGLPYLTPTPATLLAAPLPAPETCKSLPENIVVTAPTGRPQCQQLGAGGIGNASVIERGIIDAVDIWSWLGAGVQVCFRQSSGTLLFLDAATSPRAVSELPVFNIDGMICVFIDRPGTVVLVPGPPLPAATDTPPSYQSLSGCMVYTQYALNFRDAPDGKLIRVLPFNVTLTALQRTDGWFKVDYYGAQGWISARHVEPIGTCG